MLHHARHRTTRLLLAASYLAANVLGGWVHDHSDSHTAGDTCCTAGPDGHAEHEHGHHSLANDALPIGSPAFTGAAGAAHDDDCTICRSSGQRMLPVEGFSPIGVFAAGVQADAILPSAPDVALARSLHLRAPPLVL